MTSTEQELIKQFKKHLPRSTASWPIELAATYDKYKEYLDPHWMKKKLISSRNQAEFYRRLWELCFCSAIDEAGDYSFLSIPGRIDNDRGPDFLLQSPSNEKFYVECVFPCPSKSYVKLLNHEPYQNDIDNILDENLIVFSYINNEWFIYFCDDNTVGKHKVIRPEISSSLNKFYTPQNSLDEHSQVKDKDSRKRLRDIYKELIKEIKQDPEGMQPVKNKTEFQRKVMSSIKTKQEGQISGWAGGYNHLPLVIAMCAQNLPNSLWLDSFHEIPAGCFYPVDEFWATIEDEKMSLKINERLQIPSVISGEPIETNFFLQEKYREISAVVFYPGLSNFKAVQVNNCNALSPFNSIAPHVQVIIDYDKQKKELKIKRQNG